MADEHLTYELELTNNSGEANTIRISGPCSHELTMELTDIFLGTGNKVQQFMVRPEERNKARLYRV